MKFGFRIPSLTKRIAARTSVKSMVQSQLSLKAPRCYGWVTNPKKFVYNKVYNKTSSGCMVVVVFVVVVVLILS